MKKLAAVLVLVAIAATFSAGVAAEDDQIQIPPKEGGWEVAELIRTITEYTDQSVQYDPNSPAVRGRKIEWSGTFDLRREKLFRWFRSVLYQHRLVLVPTGPEEANLWALVDVNSPQAASHPVYVPAEDLSEWADADGVYITTTIKLKNLKDTSRARNALAQMSSRPGGRISDVPDARSFVITDYAPVVCAMARQLEALDVPEKPAPSVREASQEKLRLQQCLVGSRTEVAAQYFLNEIRALDARTQ